MEVKTCKYKSYHEMNAAHQQMVNAFPITWVFGCLSEQSLKEKLSVIGATSLDECVSIASGGIIHKDRAASYVEMGEQILREREEFLATEEGLTDAIYEEMCNHEYGYTNDPEDTLFVFDKTEEDIRTPGLFSSAWKKAEERIRKE